ncbi:hypothetical protein BASA83_013407 [Batrachochytrium salamandrivorans]|nr:hypothetical protein BASA83_013407 [Batrachochytrium salamandrivorans]
MVSDNFESMVPLGDHLTSPVKILTRSLIIHGHVSKLENFHTLLKTLFPPPSCMHPDSRSTCSTCSESLFYSIIAVRRKISAHWSAFFLDIIPRHFQAVMNHLCAQRHMRWNIRAARDNSLYPRPRSNTPIKPPPNSRRIISWNINGLVSKRNDLREHIAEVKPLLLMLQETNLDTNAFRFTAPKYSFIQHPANGPGKRGIALRFLAVLPAREIEGVPGTLILAKVPGLTEQQRKVSSWGFGLHVVSFSGSKATFRGRTATARWSSIDHFVSNLPDGCDSDTVTNRLLDIINPNTAFSSLSNLPLIDTPVPVQHRRLYRATTKKAICKAKNAYRAWLASRKLYFEFTGNHTRSSNPIRNEGSVLQFQPISICNTLRSHYMRLAEAGEGHSLDPTHWETMPQPPQHIPPSSTLSMDLPFSLRELDHALGSMHPRKAPGDDGITTALMQAIAHDPKDHGTGDVNLDRPGALALLRVANTIFLSGVIPKVWRSGSLLSDPFPVQRGVRQGCSPLRAPIQCLHQYVLDGVAPISVPGLSQEHHPRGLMFADDIAIIAPSHESLCTSMGTIADWATRWEMSFGVAKCGFILYTATPTQTQLTHPIQLHGIDLPSVSQYEYLGVIIDDLLNLSPWLAKKKRAITAAAHSISPLLRNNFLSTRYRLTIFNGLVLGVAYYGPRTHRRQFHSRSSTSSACQYRHSHDLKAPLFTPIAPMLTDCGIISLDAHANWPASGLTVKATTLKTPLRTITPIYYSIHSL